MGILQNPSSGEMFTLDVRNLIGRGMTCGIPLMDSKVSGEHASLSWDGERWSLKDLGSSNGSFVDGWRLAAGERVMLSAHSRIGFGQDDGAWQLLSVGAPAARARLLSGGLVVEGSSGVLVLPSRERPMLSIRWTSGLEWVAESVTEPDAPNWCVADQDLVQAGGVGWRVFLPQPLRMTDVASP